MTVRLDGEVTRIVDLRQSSPCRVLFPRPGSGRPLQAVLVNTGGGLVEGDRLFFKVSAKAGARLAVTTQAAEKVYRSISSVCDQANMIDIERGALVDWAPQETILFEGARLRRTFSADLESGARLIAGETVVFGRVACGERFTKGLLQDNWRIRRDGKLIWADALRLVDDIAGSLRKPFGFGDAAGCATLIYVGDDAASFLPLAREAAERGPWQGGASIVNGLLVARLLDTDEARLRSAAEMVRAALRSELARQTGF